MKNIIIKCQECNQEFPWTIGEQKFYQEKSLEKPTRCMICRGIQKAREKDHSQYRKK